MQYVNLYKIKKVIQAKMPFYTVFFPLVGKPFDDPEQVTFLKGRKLSLIYNRILQSRLKIECHKAGSKLPDLMNFQEKMEM
jgi:hypothetical protein